MEIFEVSNNWATRKADERYISLQIMQNVAVQMKKESRQWLGNSKNIRFESIKDGNITFFVKGEKEGGKFKKATKFEMTDWSFQQLCNRIMCPATFMQRLSADTAVRCLNERAEDSESHQIQFLTRESPPSEGQAQGNFELRAATSEKYGRIWNADILDELVTRFGDGVTGRYKVPGEFDVNVPITQGNTTLYMSDRDMYVFLCDEQNRIELPNRRNGQRGNLARGFILWNSETGHKTFGVSTFYFDYVCANRIIWGAEAVQKIKMRHSKFAPEKFARDVLPGLQFFADGSMLGIETAIEEARKRTFEGPEVVSDVLVSKLGLTKKSADKVSMIHFMEEEKPIENWYDLTNGLTAFAKTIPFQAERVAIETQAGQILRSFAGNG
jgi:hypothetical protein